MDRRGSDGNRRDIISLLSKNYLTRISLITGVGSVTIERILILLVSYDNVIKFLTEIIRPLIEA